MGNWIVLTGEDIQLLDTEITIMASIQPLQSLDVCVQNAANYARGYIAGGANPLEPSPAVPPECVDDVICLARASYLAQEPTGTLLTKVRQDERTLAIAHLHDIAKDIVMITAAVVSPTEEKFGKWGCTQAFVMRTDPTTTTPAAPVPPSP